MSVNQRNSGLWLRATVSATALSAALAVSDGAMAQNPRDLRGQTVEQRARPDYDAIGIPAGGFRFFPQLVVEETYDDNIFGNPTGERDDFITRITPELRLDSQWSRHSLRFRAFSNINRYIDIDDENNVEYGVNATGRLDLANEGTVNADIGYGRSTVARTDPEESGRRDPEQADQLFASAGYTQNFARFTTTIAGEYQDYDAKSNLDRDKNRKQYTGRVRVAFNLSPAINVFAEPYYTIRDFDNLDIGGVNRDSDVYGAVGGIGYDITGIIYGETAVGYYNVKFDDPRFRKTSGVAVRSSTTWNVTALTSVITTVTRDNVITNNAFASSRKRMALDLEIQHELMSFLLLNARGRYESENFEGSPRKDKTYTASVGADYFINNNFALFAEYRYERRDSTVALEEYGQNRVTIGVRARL